MDGVNGLDQALARICAPGPDDRPTLRCEDAFTLAAQFGLPIEAIGRLCDERRIKIVGCQLGCFP